MTPISSILTAVAAEFGVTVDDLRGPSRRGCYAYPRQMVMYLGRNLTPWSLDRIGAELGGRDHTTIMHGVAAVTRRLAEDLDLVERLERIKARVAR